MSTAAVAPATTDVSGDAYRDEVNAYIWHTYLSRHSPWQEVLRPVVNEDAYGNQHTVMLQEPVSTPLGPADIRNFVNPRSSTRNYWTIHQDVLSASLRNLEWQNTFAAMTTRAFDTVQLQYGDLKEEDDQTYTANDQLEAAEDARRQGFIVHYSDEYTLQLDLDTPASLQTWVKQGPAILLRENVEVENIIEYASKSGNTHVIIECLNAMDISTRIRLQRLLGSDPRREKANEDNFVRRFARGRMMLFQPPTSELKTIKWSDLTGESDD
jgi:hypothetical protein